MPFSCCCEVPAIVCSASALQFQGKLETLKHQAGSKPLLKDVVAADKAAKVATVSCRS